MNDEKIKEYVNVAMVDMGLKFSEPDLFVLGVKCFRKGYEQGKSEVLKELSKLKTEVIPRIVNADWINTKFEVGNCYESEIINELFRKFDYNNHGDGNIEKQSLTSQPQSQDSSSVGNVPTNEGSNIPSNIHPDTQPPQKNSQSPTSDCSKLAGESLRAKEQEADE